MTELNTITNQQISELQPQTFFDLLETQGISISLSILEKFLNFASSEVKKTEDYNFFKGFYSGRTDNDII